MTEFDKTPTPNPTYDSSKVPAEIRKIANYVRTKYKGEDILEAIAQSSEIAGLIANEALEVQAYDGNSLADVTLAKDGLPTLDARIRRDVDSLENKKADKSEVTAQLARKVDKGNVSVSDINKNLGKLDQTFMSEEFLQQMAGDTPINAVPADGSITTSKLANNSVTTSKIANNSININKLHLYDSFPNLNWESGQFDSDGSPLPTESPTRLRSMGFMKLSQGDKITAYDGYRFNLFFYSEANQSTFTNELNAWVTNYTVTNDTYVRIQISHTDNLDLSDKTDEIDSMIRTNHQGVLTGEYFMDNSIPFSKVILENTLSNLNWESGQFDGDGTPLPSAPNTRLRCMSFMKLSQGDKITAYDGYRFNLFFYSEANQSTFTNELNAWVTSYTVTNDTYVRIQISHTDNLDLSDKIDEIDSMIKINQGMLTGEYFMDGTINMSKLSDNLQNAIGINNKQVDLFIFMGQSNMAGRGTASQAPSVPSGHGYEFKSISDPTRLYDIVEPFGVAENNATSGVTEGNKTGSMVSALANVYYDLTKTPIVGVSCSKGGTSINFWQPESAPLLDAINRFETAENWLINNGYTIRNKSMVWCQGESDGDSSMAGSEYKAKFNTMVTEMFNVGIENCYLVRIGNHRDDPSLYNEIINSQTEIAKETSNVILVSTKFDKMASDGLMKDQFHYTQTGYNIVGEEAGTNIAYHVNNKKEPVIYDWENKELYYSYK